MFIKGIPVIFSFEDGITLDRVLKMEEEMGTTEFGKYISRLVEKDFYEEVIEEKLKDRVKNTPSMVDTEAISELLTKVNQLIEKGVPISQITPPKPDVKSARAGDISTVEEIIETPVVQPVRSNKPKRKLGGLRNKDSILSKMDSMTK